jgi:hypothetical protein
MFLQFDFFSKETTVLEFKNHKQPQGSQTTAAGVGCVYF